ncbi:hypothetical protein DPMN_038587 [Dreissena polymorpha]|uniref:Uncharacterized protein n=1 Tax=Dreissena polymorpha TaxID=45954 RepID=A0A9D4RNT2_DREPO|nr:hypothetical protein DPMN_038587 [Dreissena polymorpha]
MWNVLSRDFTQSPYPQLNKNLPYLPVLFHLHLHHTSAQSHLIITRLVVLGQEKDENSNDRIDRRDLIVKSLEIEKVCPATFSPIQPRPLV